MNNRLNWIDVAKGIGMILVIAGHVQTVPVVKGIIYSFHMPLFFFISGFLYKAENYKRFSVLLKNKAKTLLVPYVIFAVVSYAIYFIWERKVLETDDWSGPLIGFLLSNSSALSLNTPLWFLTCLFVVHIYYFFIQKVNNKKLVVLVIPVALIVVAEIYRTQIETPLPWSAHTAIMGTLFFHIGVVVKRFKTFECFKNNALDWSILFMSLCVGGSLLNNKVMRPDMLGDIYNNMFLYVPTALFGICAVCLLSQTISSRSISFVGRHTLTFLGLQMNAIFLINYVNGEIRARHFYEVNDSLQWSFIYTVTTIMILCAAISLNRYVIAVTNYIQRKVFSSADKSTNT